MTDCSHIEGLLSRYSEGDCTDPERRLVAEHLRTCSMCRESYELYALLERSLEERRSERPPAAATAAAVARRLGLRRRRPMDVILSAQSITIFISLVIAAVFIVYRQHITVATSRLAGPVGNALVELSNILPAALLKATGGVTWILITVSMLIAVLIALAYHMTAMRYAHR